MAGFPSYRQGVFNFMRKLSLNEILIAFPEEAKELVPKQITKLNARLRPYKEWITNVYKQDYDDFTKWFIIEASKSFAPMAEIRQLENLNKMKRIMNRKSSDIDVEQAKSVLISSLIDVVVKNGKQWSQCPFHADGQEKTPSMLINKNNSFYCFSCSAHGDSISFIMKTEKINFIEAVKYLNKL